MVILGFFAWEQMIFPYEENYYYFFASSITALMSAGIVFIVYVQRKAIATPFQAFIFEIAKSLFATGLWLWLILDSAFGPRRGYYTEPELVRRRVQRDALASLLLL
ncbi:hypothetical protein J4E91_004393 [Alternaria rosae]|nr:hypothetical protein J4E91_004393 [Alternaria rosae]